MAEPRATFADNLAGAWAVMLGRPQGLMRLDLSIRGFWRSFGAVVLVVPFVVLALLSERSLSQAAERAASPLAGGDIAGAMMALLADWVTFPIVLALLARPFGFSARYLSYVVARNWSAVIVAAMIATVHALHLIGILPTGAAPLVLLAALVMTLRFAFVVVRTTLATPIGLTLALVMLDFLISFAIWGAFERLSYPAG